MKFSICVAFLALVVAVSCADKPHYDLKDAEALFEKFIKDYKRNYHDEEDKQEHFKAFKDSLQIINKSNSAPGGATFDITKFSDYTPEQRKHLYGLIKHHHKKHSD